MSKSTAKLAFVAALGAMILPGVAKSEWSYRASKDDLTDKKTSIASQSYKVNALRDATVIVRCKDDRLEVYFMVGEFLTVNDRVQVRYRVDKKPLQEDSWSPSGDGLAVFAVNPQTIALLMMEGKQFIFEATDYQGQPHRATYSLAGAKQHVGRVLKDCGTTAEAIRESKTPTSPVDFAGEIERWGPKTTELVKEVLAGMKKYKGAIDTTKPPALVSAVKTFYEDWLRRCKSGQQSDKECANLQQFWSASVAPQMPMAVSVIQELAPPALKEKLGPLGLNE